MLERLINVNDSVRSSLLSYFKKIRHGSYASYKYYLPYIEALFDSDIINVDEFTVLYKIGRYLLQKYFYHMNRNDSRIF